jgi:hypothetical protein
MQAAVRVGISGRSHHNLVFCRSEGLHDHPCFGVNLTADAHLTHRWQLGGLPE